jgi:hypothetical protein
LNDLCGGCIKIRQQFANTKKGAMTLGGSISQTASPWPTILQGKKYDVCICLLVEASATSKTKRKQDLGQ